MSMQAKESIMGSEPTGMIKKIFMAEYLSEVAKTSMAVF